MIEILTHKPYSANVKIGDLLTIIRINANNIDANYKNKTWYFDLAGLNYNYKLVTNVNMSQAPISPTWKFSVGDKISDSYNTYVVLSHDFLDDKYNLLNILTNKAIYEDRIYVEKIATSLNLPVSQGLTRAVQNPVPSTKYSVDASAWNNEQTPGYSLMKKPVTELTCCHNQDLRDSRTEGFTKWCRSCGAYK